MQGIFKQEYSSPEVLPNVTIASATNGRLLSLAGGAAGTASAYTAGKFIIRLWGAPVGYIG